MTPKDIIINDVYVDPKNSQHVLLATDRSGVLESDDGSVSFHPINQGFSERQVSSMVTDPQNPHSKYGLARPPNRAQLAERSQLERYHVPSIIVTARA